MKKLACILMLLCLLVVAGSGEAVAAASVTHEISVVQSTHGSITPKGVNGIVKVKDGRNQTFTVTPKLGWYAYQVLVDGKSASFKRSGKKGIYTFKKVSADHIISVTFLDVKKPSTPQDLVAVATSTSEISLSWEASADNAGSVTYKVYVGGKAKMNASTTSSTVSGLESGTKYCFKIAAVDTTGNESKKSAQVYATTLTTVIIPPPPVSANTVPVADAGEQQTVIVGDTVQLDGSGSFDADGDTLTYRWKLSRPEGSNTTLSDEAAKNPTFVPDVGGVEGRGIYVAWLTVNDGKKNSLGQGVGVTVLPGGFDPIPESDYTEKINFVVNEKFASEHADTLTHVIANIVADKNTVLDRGEGNKKHYVLDRVMTYPNDPQELYKIKDNPAYFTDNNFIGNKEYGGTTIVYWTQPDQTRLPQWFHDRGGSNAYASSTVIGKKKYGLVVIAEAQERTTLLGKENLSPCNDGLACGYEQGISVLLHELGHTHDQIGIPEWYSMKCYDNSGTLPTLGLDYQAWYPQDPMSGADIRTYKIKEYKFAEMNSRMLNANANHQPMDTRAAARLVRIKIRVVDATGTPVPNAGITVYGGVKDAGTFGIPSNMEEVLQKAVTDTNGETPITNNPAWYAVGVKASSGGKYAGAMIAIDDLKYVFFILKQREYVLTLTLQ